MPFDFRDNKVKVIHMQSGAAVSGRRALISTYPHLCLFSLFFPVYKNSIIAMLLYFSLADYCCRHEENVGKKIQHKERQMLHRRKFSEKIDPKIKHLW